MACDAATLITLAQQTNRYGQLSKRDLMLCLAAVYCVTGQGWTAQVAVAQASANGYLRFSLTDILMSLLSVLCGAAGGGGSAPNAPGDVNISDSTPDNTHIIVTWTQTAVPDTNEVHRSINGGAFIQIATVAGATTTYTDTAGMPSGDLWTYKIRAVKNGLDSAFSSTVSIANQLDRDQGTLAVSISYPDLVIVFQQLSFHDSPNLTTVSFPLLRKIESDLLGFSCPALTSFSMPALTRSRTISMGSNTSLASLPFPLLTTLAATITPINIDGCTALTSTNFPLLNLPLGNFFQYFLSNCALNAASVNQFLARGVASGISGQTLNLNGGTNAAPTGQGVIDKAALQVNNTVNTN